MLGIADFRALFVGHLVSSVGDAVTVTALPLLVLVVTGSGLYMGLVGLLQTAPDFFFGLIAGALADRWDRRRIMLWGSLAQGVLTALIPLSVLLHASTLAVVLAVTVPLNVLRVLVSAARVSSVPDVVAREQLGPAHSLNLWAFAFGFVVGPGIAGALSGAIGPGLTIGVDAASFLFSAATTALVRTPMRPPSRADKHLLQDIREGLVFVWRSAAVRTMLSHRVIVSFCLSPAIPMMTYYVTVDRHVAPATLGYVLSAYSVGTLIGTAVGGVVTNRSPAAALLAGYVAMGVIAIALAHVAGTWALMALTALMGFADPMGSVAALSVLTALPPPELVGRVTSVAKTAVSATRPLGLFAMGLMLDRVGGARTLTTMGIALTCVTVAFAFAPALHAIDLKASRARAPAR